MAESDNDGSVSCEEVQPGDKERRERSRSRGSLGRGGGGGRGNAEPSKLFIGQLSFDADDIEEDIRAKFEKYGEIESVQVVKDRDTGKSKGFGFIKFKEVEDAERVLRTMDGAEIAGRRCKLDRAGKGGGKGGGDRRDDRGGRDRDRDGRDRDRDGRGRDDDRGRDGKTLEPDKLFIGRLSVAATEDDIHDAFKNAGDVQVQIVKDRETGDSRGFGFIKFQDAAAADRALRTMQGVNVAGEPCRLERASTGGKGKGKGGRGGRNESMSRSPSRRGQRRPVRAESRARSPPRRPPPRGDYDDRDAYASRRRPRAGQDDWEDDGHRERGDHRGRRREAGGRDERGDLPRTRAAEPRGGREREHRSRTPDGLPKKSEAINAARAAYEDAFRAAQDAQAEADSAEAALKKMQKVSDLAVDRKVSEETERIKQDLEDKLADIKVSSKNRLADTIEDSELKLRQELNERLQELRKEYELKIQDEKERIKTTHREEAEEEQIRVQEDADAEIKELRKKAEEEENPWEWIKARDKAVDHLTKVEEKLQSYKRRLENLTGQPVKDPVSRGARDRDAGKRGAAPPPPRARAGEEEESYSYSEEEVVEQAPRGRAPPPPARRNYERRY
eukprot:TRINITY_DN1044_c0_g1_i2.p1 TRINITY_DN1044_c0_g1~~TRINITY_DN1044_c0_g1_i2.p1  ORF type:complete len:632 (-),score=137.35 TRINITY_DN1044_c0_g1_i2:429-2279(-)